LASDPARDIGDDSETEAPHDTQRETFGEFLYPHAGQTIGFAVAFDMSLIEG
jgi:hypothetical protein